MMQHYGAPTLLLDWTDGALIALQFAINGHQEPDDARICVLNSYQLDRQLKKSSGIANVRKQWPRYLTFHPKSVRRKPDWYDVFLPCGKQVRSRDKMDLPACPMLDDPDSITRRFGAQRSRFMLFGRDPYWLNERLREGAVYLAVIQVENSSIGDMRQQLRDAGITESVIFPELQGLGREMEHEWKARLRW